MRNRQVIYFVEGECEERLIRSLVNDFSILIPGRIRILNIAQKRIPKSIYTTLRQGSCIVFVFDTDAGEPQIAEENIKALARFVPDAELVVIPQNRNLEDELCRACGLREIRTLTRSRSRSDFKKDFIHASNLQRLMEECGFDFNLLWTGGTRPAWDNLKTDNIDTIIKAISFRRRKPARKGHR